MTIKAKEVLNGKFWLVEDEGVRIGTLTINEDKTVGGLTVMNGKNSTTTTFMIVE